MTAQLIETCAAIAAVCGAIMVLCGTGIFGLFTIWAVRDWLTIERGGK